MRGAGERCNRRDLAGQVVCPSTVSAALVDAQRGESKSRGSTDLRKSMSTVVGIRRFDMADVPPIHTRAPRPRSSRALALPRRQARSEVIPEFEFAVRAFGCAKFPYSTQ